MKDIKGYENLYAVTSCGKVWSYRTKKFLKPTTNTHGYVQVNLYKDNKNKTCTIHRLVAETYIIKPLNCKEINHKNEIKTDNNINNLEWCNAKYNSNYGKRTEKIAKALRKPVYCVELDKVFCGIRQAAKETKAQRTNISNCIKGKAKTAGGYHWKLF